MTQDAKDSIWMWVVVSGFVLTSVFVLGEFELGLSWWKPIYGLPLALLQFGIIARHFWKNRYRGEAK